MPWVRGEVVIERQHGVQCDRKCLGMFRPTSMTPDLHALIGRRCKCGGTYVEYQENVPIAYERWEPGPPLSTVPWA